MGRTEREREGGTELKSDLDKEPTWKEKRPLLLISIQKKNLNQVLKTQTQINVICDLQGLTPHTKNRHHSHA